MLCWDGSKDHVRKSRFSALGIHVYEGGGYEGISVEGGLDGEGVGEMSNCEGRESGARTKGGAERIGIGAEASSEHAAEEEKGISCMAMARQAGDEGGPGD